MPYDKDHLDLPVTDVARRDFRKLFPPFTVQEALDPIRRGGMGERIIYFYVVDERRRIVGVVDVGVFTDEVFDVARREQLDEVFETIGFRVSQVRDASPVRAFRLLFYFSTAAFLL